MVESFCFSLFNGAFNYLLHNMLVNLQKLNSQ